MKDLEQWYKELISDQIWFEVVSKNHKPETFKKIAEQVYKLGLSDRESFAVVPLKEHRNHVVNKLNKILPDKVVKPWYHIEKEEKKEEWKPASPEHVDKCVKEFDEMMKSAPMNNAFPRIGYKQQVEEGGWLPKKEAPYPITSVNEAYVKERHLQYIKANYEPRTGQPLPEWIPESEFNLLYDERLL